MNIIDFWKEYVAERSHYSQYDKKDFLQALSTNVPNWKEQIKNRDIWPDLHCYGRNINESLFVDVIVEEAGIDFACYLAENATTFMDEVSAMSYCTKRISSNWSSFPHAVQEKILTYKLKEFLDECLRNADLWANLSAEQKASVLKKAEQAERSYVFDIMLFNLWSNELNYKDTPYVQFSTSMFKHLKEELLNENDTQRRRESLRHLECRLGGWDMPLVYKVFTCLRYTPSQKLSEIKQVAIDDESARQIDAVINQIRNLVE